MGRQPSDLNEERTIMLKAGLFLAFFFVVIVLASGDQSKGNAALQRYLSMSRPNSMIFMHPTRSMMDKRPNSLMNALKGKRAFLHSSPNSFNFPIWTRSVMEMEEPEDDQYDAANAGMESLYENIEKYGKRADGNFDVFL